MKIEGLQMKSGQPCLLVCKRSIALVMMMMLAMVSFAADLSWDFKFSPSDIKLTSRGQYTFVGIVDGASPRDAIGAPAMPAKYANILLPEGATDVTVTADGDLVLLASDVTPWPTQHMVPKSKKQPPFVDPDPVAYASTKAWPAVAATNEGVHEMQGRTFVSVRVNPVVYVASEKALYYRPVVTVTVNYNTSSTPRNGMQGATKAVNALVVNPEKSSAPVSGRRSASDIVDYLIITSNSLKNAFQELADYRATAEGGSYSTLVMTKEDISANYEGDDVQMKIRNCITDYYNNHGLQFVVIGGDDTIVPDRDTYANVDGEVEKHMPTDLYYSDLTGTWKASGSSYFGVTAANVDMSPEVIVGRIPVRTAAQLSGYLEKVEAYEADLTHTRNSIILGGPYAWNTYTGNARPSDDVTGDGHAGFRASNHNTVSDSEMWLRRLYRDGISPYWNNSEEADERTIKLACDCITSWDGSTCGDKPLTGANLKTWLNDGYTHLMFSGHGYPQGWGMETYDDYDSDKAAAQTALTAFVYTDACLTGAFDGTSLTLDGYPYTTEPCLGEAFVRNANGGALAYMGCARYGWGDPDSGYASNTSDGGPSTVYAYKFYHRLYEADAIAENRTVGEAFAMSKADMISQCSFDGCERWIQFGLNYLGDPAITLYPRGATSTALKAPKGLELTKLVPSAMTASWAAVDNAESYEVDVMKGYSFESSNGEPVLNADFSSTTGWTLSGTDTYKSNAYSGASAPAIKFKATGNYAITPDFGSGVRLQFWAYGNGSGNTSSVFGSTFKISGLVNGTWVVIETITIAEGGNTYELNLPAGTSKIRFDFTKNTVNCSLDDVVVYGDTYTPEAVEGYPKNVGNVTEHALTGLTPNSTYVVRVRAINSEKTSKWSTVVTGITPTDFEPGDANGDGSISISDAVSVVNCILGNPADGFSSSAADVNGDGKVTITDAVSIVNMILGKE